MSVESPSRSTWLDRATLSFREGQSWAGCVAERLLGCEPVYESPVSAVNLTFRNNSKSSVRIVPFAFKQLRREYDRSHQADKPAF